MHGRLKVKTDLQKQLEKEKERQEKAKQFLTAQKTAFQMRSNGQTDKQALEITGHLVAVNPDFATIWNYRREMILSIKNEAKGAEEVEAFDKICNNELQLIENCLRVNPKSYCAWHQRQWIIQKMPKPDLKIEISLCNQLLQIDERNFHCWDYRRFISKLAQLGVSDELKFTLHKIEQNFSNFSSWYYRSCLFTSAANNGEIDFTKEWKREYDLVENAIFTDPSDQSSWFYHKWLVSTNYGNDMKSMPSMASKGSVKIDRIVLDLRQSLLVIHTSRPLKHRPLIMIVLNEKFLTDVEWHSFGQINSSVWFAQVSADHLSKLSIDPCPTFAPNPECVERLDIESKQTNDNTLFVWERKASDSDKQIGLEDCYLKSLRELHKLEPNNKWVNLTLAWNDPNYSKMDNILDALIKLDPLRVNYYNDLKSKTLLKERMNGLQSTDFAVLSQLKLTALYDMNRLSHIQTLDLSGNNLLKLSKTFNDLICVQVLIVDSNRIYAIDKDFKLNQLRVLSINKNKISESSVLTHLKNCLKLESIIIEDNPISDGLKSGTNSELSLSDPIKIIVDSDSNECTGIVKSIVNYNLF